MNDTKQRILDVSLELFSQNGFSAVSIRDICRQVQIKESSVYYYFKSKQAIFDELLCLFQNKLFPQNKTFIKLCVIPFLSDI